MDNQKEVDITPEITPEDPPEEDVPEEVIITSSSRGECLNHLEFILSCLGYAVGYGTIWRFPYLCYKNGGALFLIPYLTILVAAGIPLLFLEMVLGQYVGLGPTTLFPQITPIFSGLGWAMFVTILLALIFYNHLISWSLFYTFSSFRSVLPWSNCDNHFNSENCFTYEGLNECKNKSLYYFNKTCLTIADYCTVSSLQNLNETHCVGSGNDTEEILVQDAVFKVSPAEDFYRNRLLGMTGKTWENMGVLNLEMVGCLALTWLLVCFCAIKGIRTSGKKIVYILAIFPYVMLIILLIRGLTLEGAYDGIHFYFLQGNISRLNESEMWYDAANQIFFSLGIGFGAVICLSSFNKVRHNCMRDAIGFGIANLFTSLLYGFATFGILGFIAHENDVSMKDVVHSGSGLAFIAFTTALTKMPFPPIWSILFFLMLVVVGVVSQIAFVETLATGLSDLFVFLKRKKPLLMIGITTACFLLGLPICLEGGIYIFELMNYYAVGFNVLFLAFLEVAVVAYCYGFTRTITNIKEDMAIPLRMFFWDYWSVTWLCFTPVSIIATFSLGIYYSQPVGFGSYIFPYDIQGIGWLLTSIPIIPIPIGAIYAIFIKKKRGKALTEPTAEFIPAHLRNKETKKSFKYILDNHGFEPEAKHETSTTDPTDPTDVADQMNSSPPSTSSTERKNPETPSVTLTAQNRDSSHPSGQYSNQKSEI